MNTVKFPGGFWRRLFGEKVESPADISSDAKVSEGMYAKDREGRVVLQAVAAVLVGLAVLVGWAAFVPLHRGASAPGRVQQESARGVVQHMDGGIVERILVKEGDLVRPGQLLVKLDDRAANLDLQLLTEQHRLLLIEQAMLNAELNEQTQIAWPPEVLAAQNDPKIQRAMLAAAHLLQSKAADDAAQKAVLAAGIDRLEANIVGIEAQRAGQEEQARLIRTELEGLQSLYDKRLVPKPRLLALQRTAADLDGSIATSIASVAQARVQMGEARMKMLQIDTQGGQEDAQRLQQIQSKLFELRDRINSQQLIVARTDIRSPVEGLVLRRAVTSPGQVLRPGDPVLDIVPADRLIVTAMIRPTDIERVKLGAPAKITLTGLNARTTPKLHGRVVYVSADLITDKDGKPVGFEARIEAPQIERRKLGAVKLTPGMPAEVMVDAGSRTALQYMLQPVTGAFGRTMRPAAASPRASLNPAPR